jgi:hypothetical protein
MGINAMSKSGFARAIGVSPARITQYINEGIIEPSALIGEGRSAKINYDIAVRQVSEMRDPTQATVNGTAELPLGAGDADTAEQQTGPTIGGNDPQRSSLDIQLKEQKLAREQRINRRAALEDATEAGRLVPAEDFEVELARAIQRTMQVYEAAVPEMARAIAAGFGAPQRDVEHTLRKVITDVRSKASKVEAERAETMPETKDLVVTGETVQ